MAKMNWALTNEMDDPFGPTATGMDPVQALNQAAASTTRPSLTVTPGAASNPFPEPVADNPNFQTLSQLANTAPSSANTTPRTSDVPTAPVIPVTRAGVATMEGYTPERITFGPEDTVESRIQGIINKNSGLMQLANTRGLQQANRRGVLNSSMAGEAAQKAVLDAAFPIASQDATGSLRVKELNQAAGNTALQFGAGERNKAAYLRQQGDQAIELAQTQGNIDMMRDGYAAQLQGYLEELKQENSIESLRLASELEKDVMAFGHELTLAQNTQLHGFDKAIQKMVIDGAYTLEQAKAEWDAELTKWVTRQEISEAQKDRILQIGLQNLQNSGAFDVAKLKSDTDLEITKLKNESDERVVGSQVFSNLMVTYNTNVGAILNNPEFNTTTKTALVNQQVNMVRDQLKIYNALFNLDLSPELMDALGLGGGGRNRGGG